MNQEQVLQRLNDGQTVQDTHVDRLDLQNRTFERPVVFERTLFTDRVTFTGCQFSRGARFFDCRFRDVASFDRCNFIDHAYFWRSCFAGDATFLESTVRLPSTVEHRGSVFPGEANFSWARFRGRASFYRTHFFGPAYFWRTLFEGPATFTESRFDAATLFAGSEHEVCLSMYEFGSVFEALLERGVLSPDHEMVHVSPNGRTTCFYAQFVGISSESQLRERLDEHQFSKKVIDAVSMFWQQHARQMFAPGMAGGDFTNACFENGEDVQFRDVNLGECRFAQCDLTKVDFADVTWDQQPLQFGFTRRAVRDERGVRSTDEYQIVSRLYRQLRKNYERQEQYEEAGDFHVGEMEMQRLGQSPPLRYVSLLACYRWLSGYGQQSTVALAWLLFFVLLLFPSLNLVTGVPSDVRNAVLHSLEVCTFLESTGDKPLPVSGRFVDGFERILVGMQAGLLLVSVKRKFGRN